MTNHETIHIDLGPNVILWTLDEFAVERVELVPELIAMMFINFSEARGKDIAKAKVIRQYYHNGDWDRTP